MNSQRATTEQRRERAELDARFGKIGISAVAAAMRYRSDAQESRLCARQAASDQRGRRGRGLTAVAAAARGALSYISSVDA